MRSGPPFAALTVALLAVACSQWQGGELVKVEGYQARVKTNPDPLRVGEAAAVTLLLRDASGQEAIGCKAHFRQYMPGMEMSRDGLFMPLKEEAPGRYLGRSGEFRMGGDWALEFRFDCGSGERVFQLKRHLAWRE